MIGRTRPIFQVRTSTNIALLVAANAALALVVLVAGSRGLILFVVIGVLLVGARLAVGLLRRPQRGVLVLAALLPFDGLLTISGFPDFVDGWKEALVVAIVASTFVAPASARGRPGRKPPPWVSILLAFFGLAFVSAIAVQQLQGFVGLKVGFFYVLIAVAVWRCPLDAAERDQLVTVLMVTGAITALGGVAQQVVGPDRLVELGWDFNENVRFAGGILRSFSTFNQSFPFALFLMLVLLIGVPSALVDVRRLRNTLFLLSVPLLMAGIVSSVTRVAWVGLIVGLAYIGSVRSRALMTVLVRAGIVLIVALVLAGGYTSTFLSERSSQERLDLWRDNASEIAAHPLGLGVGATGSAAEKVAELRDADDDEVFQPDNYYFKTAMELGVIGLWLFALLLVATFGAARRAAHGLPPPDAALADATAAMVLAAAAVSVVATYFEIFPLDAYFWMLLGVVAACSTESR